MTASLDGKLKLFTDSPKVLSGIKEPETLKQR